MTQPLRSSSLSRGVITITGCSAPVPRIGTFSLVRSAHLAFSLHIATTGSHVPYKSLMHGHAASIPDAAWPEQELSILHQRFAYAHLRSIVPDRVIAPPFRPTLTTKALYLSSLDWFEIRPYTADFERSTLISHTAWFPPNRGFRRDTPLGSHRRYLTTANCRRRSNPGDTLSRY